MKEYNLTVKREILVSITIAANSEEEALKKYQDGDTGEEDITDSSDLELPTIDEVKSIKSCSR
jgi:hypothetical protein